MRLQRANLLRFLKPRHTLTSVVRDLVAGLDDGTIVVENPWSRLFPSLVPRMQDVLASIDGSDENLVSRLFTVDTKLAQAILGLQSLIQSTQGLRQNFDLAGSQHLNWYPGLVVQRVRRLQALLYRGIAPAEMPRPMSEAISLARTLEVSLQYEPSIIEELFIRLELSLAQLLRIGLEAAVELVGAEVKHYIVVDLSFSGRYSPGQVRDMLVAAASRATAPVLEHADALVIALQMALQRELATAALYGAAFGSPRSSSFIEDARRKTEN